METNKKWSWRTPFFARSGESSKAVQPGSLMEPHLDFLNFVAKNLRICQQFTKITKRVLILFCLVYFSHIFLINSSCECTIDIYHLKQVEMNTT